MVSVSTDTNKSGISSRSDQSTPADSFGFGYNFGCNINNWFCKNRGGILLAIGLFIFCFVFLSMMKTIAESEVLEAKSSVVGSVAAYTSAVRHQRCKSRGGCCRTCPYISQDDPRVSMCKQNDNIQKIKLIAGNALQEELDAADVAIAKFDSSKQAEVKLILDRLNQQKNTRVITIRALAIRAQKLDDEFGRQAKLSTGVIAASHVMSACESMIATQAQLFAAASIIGNASLMRLRLSTIAPEYQKKIHNFDQRAAESMTHATSINEDYQKLVAMIDSNEYRDKIDKIISRADDLVVQGIMASSFNTIQDVQLKMKTISDKFEVIAKFFMLVMSKIDSFSNNLAGGKIDADKISTLIENGDYNTALIKTALEPEIVANQKKFAKERSSFDSGGGVPSVRDDDNDIVPWVGIFGRPTYRRSDGSSADQSSEPLRSIPSDNPTDLMRSKTPRLSFA